ncbi:MAG: hypothetical protein M3Q07_01270 [Pseudobdellovibrionaceae bacterium]|nr:hypothetical protein [Pseudobdellovibrionaceae bacterium]
MRPIFIPRVFFAGLLLLGCLPKAQQQSRTSPISSTSVDAVVAVPKLEIRDDLELELVYGVNGGFFNCKNEQGQVVESYPTDVLFRVRGGLLEKVENLGCPAVKQATEKPLTERRRTILGLALEEMKKITVETEEECYSDGVYAGIRLWNEANEKQFVYIIPKSRNTCKGDFISIADWDLVRDTFDMAFADEQSP